MFYCHLAVETNHCLILLIVYSQAKSCPVFPTPHTELDLVNEILLLACIRNAVYPMKSWYLK